MKKLLTMIMSLVMAFAVAVTAGPTAQAAPAGTEVIVVDGDVYYKTVGMPYYGVPSRVSSIKDEYYYDRAIRNKQPNWGRRPRMVATIQFEPAPDGVGWLDHTYFLCDGNIALNEDVVLVDILEVWPEGSNPRNTLAVFDGGSTWIPLGIETWADLFRNTTGWPKGVDENTFVTIAGVEQLRDPERNPFETPRDAWSGIFIELDRQFGQAVDFANMPIVNTDNMYVRQVMMEKGKKLFVMAKRQEDYSYKFFFLKSFNKKKPDYSEKNSLADLELAIAYLKGK